MSISNMDCFGNLPVVTTAGFCCPGDKSANSDSLLISTIALAVEKSMMLVLGVVMRKRNDSHAAKFLPDVFARPKSVSHNTDSVT